MDQAQTWNWCRRPGCMHVNATGSELCPFHLDDEQYPECDEDGVTDGKQYSRSLGLNSKP